MGARVTFIGLGAIGLPMARRLGAAEAVDLTVFDVRPEVLDAETNLGRVAESFEDAVYGADLIISVLPADAHVLAVAVEVERYGRSGQTYLDFSTVAPSTMESVDDRLAAAGLAVLGGALMRSVAAAEDGTLSIFVGGRRADIEAVIPVLEVMASEIRIVSTVGAAKALKIVNNMVVSALDVVICDSLVVAAGCGVSAHDVVERLHHAGGDSWPLRNHIEKHLLADDLGPGRFSTRYMAKDATLAIQLAFGRGEPAWFAGLVVAAYRGAVGLGYGDDYHPVVARWFEHIAGVAILDASPNLESDEEELADIARAVVALQALITLDALRIISRAGVGLADALDHFHAGSSSNDSISGLRSGVPANPADGTLFALLEALVAGCRRAEAAGVPAISFELGRSVALSLSSRFGGETRLSEVARQLSVAGMSA